MNDMLDRIRHLEEAANSIRLDFITLRLRAEKEKPATEWHRDMLLEDIVVDLTDLLSDTRELLREMK